MAVQQTQPQSTEGAAVQVRPAKTTVVQAEAVP
jgi:hypothetical protein